LWILLIWRYFTRIWLTKRRRRSIHWSVYHSYIWTSSGNLMHMKSIELLDYYIMSTVTIWCCYAVMCKSIVEMYYVLDHSILFAWDFYFCLLYIPVNPLDSKGNYSSTSNNMKLVHWPLMCGLLHLVQQGGAWAVCGPTHSPPCCTKCNSPPINGQCTNHCIAIMMVSCSAVLMWRLKG